MEWIPQMCLSFSGSSPPSVPPRAPFNRSKMREGIDENSHKNQGVGGDGWRMCERGWVSLWPWLWLLKTWTWTESHTNTASDLIAASEIKYATLMIWHLANYERIFPFQTARKSVLETFQSRNPVLLWTEDIRTSKYMDLIPGRRHI